MEKPLDPLTEIYTPDAARMLGYKSASTLLAMVRAGKIPGARKISTKKVAIPLSWVQNQIEIAKGGEPKAGKPRGYTKEE